jgi:hypothetical protein
VRHWWIVVVAFAGLVAAALWFGAAIGPGETRHRPTAYTLLGEGGAPNVIMIGFGWPHDGYCSGQFQVTAAETVTEVRVYDVVNRPPRGGGGCAGLGSDGVTAWAGLELSKPLGDRKVVRAEDGEGLPYIRRGPPD